MRPPCRYCARRPGVARRTKRRTETFSPSFCTSAWRAASTVPPSSGSAASAATSAGFFSATSRARHCAKATKSALRATKSVSQLSSTIAPCLPSSAMKAPMTPSAATRSAAFDAFAPLRMRSSCSALSMSPPASVSAFLHSIIGSPVRLRRSITMLADISAMLHLSRSSGRRAGVDSTPVDRPCRLCIPPRWLSAAGGQPKGLMPRFVPRLRRCLVPRDLDELVGLDDFLDHLAAAFENRVGDAAGIEADRPAGIVVARNDVGNAVGRVIGIDHADHRDVELGRFGHRDLLVADVDDEQGIGQRVHVLDPAQAAIELVHLPLQRQRLALAHLVEGAILPHRLEVLQA